MYKLAIKNYQCRYFLICWEENIAILKYWFKFSFIESEFYIIVSKKTHQWFENEEIGQSICIIFVLRGLQSCICHALYKVDCDTKHKGHLIAP